MSQPSRIIKHITITSGSRWNATLRDISSTIEIPAELTIIDNTSLLFITKNSPEQYWDWCPGPDGLTNRTRASQTAFLNERNRHLNYNSHLSNHEEEHDLKLAQHSNHLEEMNRLKTQPDGGWTVHMLGWRSGRAWSAAGARSTTRTGGLCFIKDCTTWPQRSSDYHRQQTVANPWSTSSVTGVPSHRWWSTVNLIKAW